MCTCLQFFKAELHKAFCDPQSNQVVKVNYISPKWEGTLVTVH